MEDLDNLKNNEISEEELFAREVICGEADLLYLDSYLSELFRKGGELRSL